MDLDDDSRLRNVFWANNRRRQAQKEFGDVVTFDTTYLTNKLRRSSKLISSHFHKFYRVRHNTKWSNSFNQFTQFQNLGKLMMSSRGRFTMISYLLRRGTKKAKGSSVSSKGKRPRTRQSDMAKSVVDNQLAQPQHYFVQTPFLYL